MKWHTLFLVAVNNFWLGLKTLHRTILQACRLSPSDGQISPFWINSPRLPVSGNNLPILESISRTFMTVFTVFDNTVNTVKLAYNPLYKVCHSIANTRGVLRTQSNIYNGASYLLTTSQRSSINVRLGSNTPLNTITIFFLSFHIKVNYFFNFFFNE